MPELPTDQQPDRRVDLPLAFRVYQLVREKGERNGDTYSYAGLQASSDFDGYTVQLSDGTITLQIFFHNRFAISPVNKRHAVDQFLARIARVAKEYERS